MSSTTATSALDAQPAPAAPTTAVPAPAAASARDLRPTHRLVSGRGLGVAGVALLLVLGGTWASWWLLVGLGLALAALVTIEVTLVRGERATTVSRRVTPLVVARGEPVEGVVHAWLPASRVQLDRRAVDLVDGSSQKVDLPSTRRAESVTATYPIATPRRGLIEVGPLVVHSGGPLGLAGRNAVVGGTIQVRVLPRPARIHTLPAGRRRSDTGVDERVDRGGTDIVGLHEYEAGDDLRLVHWASSARTGRLMVREDSDPAAPHLLLLLDDRQGAYGHQRAIDFEEAVDFVAGLSECGLEHGRHVRLQTLSGTIDVEVGARLPRAVATRDSRLAHALAEAELLDNDQVGSVSSRDQDIVVLVTGSQAPDVEMALLLAGAAHPVLVRLDPELAETSVGPFGVVTLRAAGATELATAWESAT